MIVESVLIAWLLSQPALEKEEIVYDYKPCASLYNEYVSLKKENWMKAALLAENIRYVCKPFNQGNSDL